MLRLRRREPLEARLSARPCDGLHITGKPRAGPLNGSQNFTEFVQWVAHTAAVCTMPEQSVREGVTQLS